MHDLETSIVTVCGVLEFVLDGVGHEIVGLNVVGILGNHLFEKFDLNDLNGITASENFWL